MSTRCKGLRPGPDPRTATAPKFKASLYVKAVTALTKSVSYDMMFPPAFDQGQEGSCVSNASAGLYMGFRSKRRHESIMPSRRVIYFDALTAEKQPLEDDGAWPSDGVQSLQASYVPEAEWPYAYLGTPQFFQTPPQNLRRTDYLLAAHYAVSPDPLSIQRALNAHGPIIIGLTWANEWNELDATNILSTENLTVDGGHCVLITGYKYINGALVFRIRNSWGTDWADNGYCWLPASLYGTQFWPFTLFAVKAPA
jgi:hypothetical protein